MSWSDWLKNFLEKYNQKRSDKKVSERALPNCKTKNGVIINGAHFFPEVARIIQCALATAPEFTDETLWVTSANDSQHMLGSLHYENKAFDLRIWNVVGGRAEVDRWAVRLRTALGYDYDVVVESDHLHVELDPDTNSGNGL